MVRYCKLWAKYHTSPFTYANAKETLDENDKRLSVILSNLKLKGWLKVERNKDDARKRIYFLLEPREVMDEIAKNSD